MLIVNLLKQSTLKRYRAKLLSISCVIVEHKYDFNSFNLEKLCSAETELTPQFFVFFLYFGNQIHIF